MATAEETFAMVGKESLWEAAVRCHEALRVEGIPHAIVGGVAVCDEIERFLLTASPMLVMDGAVRGR